MTACQDGSSAFMIKDAQLDPAGCPQPTGGSRPRTRNKKSRVVFDVVGFHPKPSQQFVSGLQTCW